MFQIEYVRYILSLFGVTWGGGGGRDKRVAWGVNNSDLYSDIRFVWPLLGLIGPHSGPVLATF